MGPGMRYDVKVYFDGVEDYAIECATLEEAEESINAELEFWRERKEVSAKIFKVKETLVVEKNNSDES